MKLVRDAKTLKEKAIASLKIAMATFNSYEEEGRITSVLLHLQRMRRFRPIDFAIAARLSTAWAWHCELVGESWTRSF